MSNQEELLTRIKAGVFTMRDMQEQFMNIQKLGPIGQVMVRRRAGWLAAALGSALPLPCLLPTHCALPSHSVQSMLPGFGQDFLGKEGEEESTRMMKKNMTIMKSMCDAGMLAKWTRKIFVECGRGRSFWILIDGAGLWSAREEKASILHLIAPFFFLCVSLFSLRPRLEMDSPNCSKLFRLQQSRAMRVARGAGARPEEVEMLLVQYKKFSDLVKKMGGIKVRRGRLGVAAWGAVR
jgi:hypothetical protein